MLSSIAWVMITAAEKGATEGSSFDTFWLGIGGFGTFLAALAGAFVVLRKYGPEVNKVQIESANAVVEMAKTAAAMSAAQAKDLLERNKALDDRVTELARVLGEQAAQIEELQKVAGLVEELKRERTRLLQDNRRLSRRVTDLEKELALVRQEQALQHQHQNEPNAPNPPNPPNPPNEPNQPNQPNAT